MHIWLHSWAREELKLRSLGKKEHSFNCSDYMTYLYHLSLQPQFGTSRQTVCRWCIPTCGLTAPHCKSLCNHHEVSLQKSAHIKHNSISYGICVYNHSVLAMESASKINQWISVFEHHYDARTGSFLVTCYFRVNTNWRKLYIYRNPTLIHLYRNKHIYITYTKMA